MSNSNNTVQQPDDDDNNIQQQQQANFNMFIMEDFNTYEHDVAPKPIITRIQNELLKTIILAILTCLVTYDMIYCMTRIEIWKSFLLLYGGSFVADVFVGLCHMWMDHIPMDLVPASQRPILQWLAFGFQIHHVDGNNWRRDDIFYLGLLRTGFFLFLPISMCHLFVYSHYSHRYYYHHNDQQQSLLLNDYYKSIFLWSLEIFCLFSQFAHAAAHGRWRTGTWGKCIRLLQKSKIIIDPKDHHLHHTSFNKNFAIITGHANPLLNWSFQHIFSHFVSDDMLPHIQQKIYVEEKSKLTKPYFVMFPAWRRENNNYNSDSNKNNNVGGGGKVKRI
jgi:hypothetical protein